jgi:succinate-semialdehyde dehydrogenase/glutarate-semialdehyde dehydrogenase
MLDCADEIADLISRENGKTVTAAMSAEIVPIADLIAYFAKNAEQLLEVESIPIRHWGLFRRRSYLHYPPLGVLGVISPWNFPFSIPMGTVVMALAAGNTVVLKPSEVTPLVGLKIGEILRAGGLPDGCCEIVTGDGSTGAALCEAPIDKLFFTGSTRTGRRVMEACAKRLTPVSLELGGNAPMIVLKDANIENAVAGAVWGAFFNSGQVCASVQRIYVDRAIAEPFTARLVEETKKVRTGVGRGWDCEIGALTSEMQLKIVEDLVEDAKKRGAKVLCGGKRAEVPGAKGYFYEPTLLAGVDHGFRIVKEEIFGPVASIMTFDTEDEAVRLANDTSYGLMASVWTADVERGERIARRIESGTVCVNDHAMTHGIPETPWGGIKQSGFGRTHGKLGLLEMVQWRHVHVNAASGIKLPWWFPEQPGTYRGLKKTAEAFGRRSLVKRAAALVGAARELVFGSRKGSGA